MFDPDIFPSKSPERVGGCGMFVECVAIYPCARVVYIIYDKYKCEMRNQKFLIKHNLYLMNNTLDSSSFNVNTILLMFKVRQHSTVVLFLFILLFAIFLPLMRNSDMFPILV